MSQSIYVQAPLLFLPLLHTSSLLILSVWVLLKSDWNELGQPERRDAVTKDLFHQGLCEGEGGVPTSLWSAGVFFMVVKAIFKVWLTVGYAITSVSFISEMSANHAAITLISVKDGDNSKVIPASYHRQLDPKQGARVSVHRMGTVWRAD